MCTAMTTAPHAGGQGRGRQRAAVGGLAKRCVVAMSAATAVRWPKAPWVHIEGAVDIGACEVSLASVALVMAMDNTSDARMAGRVSGAARTARHGQEAMATGLHRLRRPQPHVDVNMYASTASVPAPALPLLAAAACPPPLTHPVRHHLVAGGVCVDSELAGDGA
ncbi:hypothetical protein C1I95_20200 [Micromonospora craterilacus]|uniref:Uncharacterized protein n=1 Tax=Micromonospora craterilacus TaxID=1655439 RepID=A0A2W2DXE1_9ACTN|nr:hypothetical protein C1I95_20200 [Micromonospora craterilacus]